MISIKDLIGDDRGRLVIYKAHNYNEEGVITSWNETYIFVRYDSDKGSKATRPDDLEFCFKR